MPRKTTRKYQITSSLLWASFKSKNPQNSNTKNHRSNSRFRKGPNMKKIRFFNKIEPPTRGRGSTVSSGLWIKLRICLRKASSSGAWGTNLKPEPLSTNGPKLNRNLCLISPCCHLRTNRSLGRLLQAWTNNLLSRPMDISKSNLTINPTNLSEALKSWAPSTGYQ